MKITKSSTIILLIAFFIAFSAINLMANVREGNSLMIKIAIDSYQSGTELPIEDSSGGELFEDFEDEFGEPASSDIFDPLSGYNRLMTTFNDKLYFWLVKPVAKGYKFVVPEGGRQSVNRFFKNLSFPVRFVNNALQLKFKAAGIELSRFCINSTVGIVGFWDPAKSWLALEDYPEDFGQTLGYYGVGGGFHIVLPVLGPSNLRDSISLIPDYFLEPVSLVEPDLDELAVTSYDKLNFTSLNIGKYESIKRDAVDLYPFLRDAYKQNRKKKIEE